MNDAPLFRFANAQESDLNTGKPWSKTDDQDLRDSNAFGSTVGQTATFLMRTHEEIFKRSRELGIKWSVQLRRTNRAGDVVPGLLAARTVRKASFLAIC